MKAKTTSSARLHKHTRANAHSYYQYIYVARSLFIHQEYKCMNMGQIEFHSTIELNGKRWENQEMGDNEENIKRISEIEQVLFIIQG